MRILTKIEVSPKEVFAEGITDPYAWHRTLWKSFPGKDGEKRSFLFRVEKKDSFFRVYMISPEEPVPLPWGNWKSKTIPDSFFDGELYRFQLKANPTRRIGSGKDKGKRVGIYKNDELDSWIRRKTADAGAELLEAANAPPVTEYFLKNGRKNKLCSVDFSGICRVNNRNKLVNTFESGIGSAKSLGFGLLIMKKIN